MNLDKESYKTYAEARARKSNLFVNCIKAFLFGGIICTLGEAFGALYQHLGMEKESASSLVCVTLIFIAAFLTAIGVFDQIAKHAGAGTLVPITGFANAVVAPAIDNKGEGFVLGVGAKMFTVAGPVIVYGTVASIIYGVIYYFFLR